MIKAAIMGFGTIGSGVAEVLDINKKSIAARVGDEGELKDVLDLRDFEGDPIQSKIVHDYKVIAEDPEVSIVVETMGGVEPARTYIVQALEAGKQVVTANKDVLAEHGQEILSLAENSGCDIQFEAAVAGAIPIIRPLKQSLAPASIAKEVHTVIVLNVPVSVAKVVTVLTVLVSITVKVATVHSVLTIVKVVIVRIVPVSITVKVATVLSVLTTVKVVTVPIVPVSTTVKVAAIAATMAEVTVRDSTTTVKEDTVLVRVPLIMIRMLSTA